MNVIFRVFNPAPAARLFVGCLVLGLAVCTSGCERVQAREAQVIAVDPISTVAPAPAAASSGPLWGYMDGAGLAHFADRQVDSRYALVLGDGRQGSHVLGKKAGPEALLTWLEFAPDVKALEPVLAEAARRTGVDRELLQAVIAVESNYDARAVSPRGAVGLMQLTPETADRYATVEERREPAARRMLDARINVLTGARMLADLTRRYGGIDIALAAWNAGEGAVRRAGGQMPAIAETEAHVHLVLELYWGLLQRHLPQQAHRLVVTASLPGPAPSSARTARSAGDLSSISSTIPG